MGGIAEGSVVGRGILGRVGDNDHIGELGNVEGRADGSHSAVHHVAGRYCIRTRLGVGHGRAGQEWQRGIVIHLARLGEHSTVTVIRVLAKAHVGPHQQVRDGVFDGTDGLRHQALRVEPGRTLSVLPLVVGNPK